MSKVERKIEELLSELIEIVEELKIALGKREKVVMGMKVKRIDTQALMLALPALERVLKEYSKGNQADEEWMSIVASFDPESQRILEVYHPKGWKWVGDEDEDM